MLGMPIHTAVATIHTNHGDIVVNLFGDHAPRTVQNFTGLADGSQAWTHPATGRPWPPIPEALVRIWRDVAGYPLAPEACLVNFYTAEAKMGQHQDRDEADFTAPVVSVSLGDDCQFRLGGTRRQDKTMPLRLQSGDVLVMGGTSRLAFHGVDRIYPDTSTLLKNGGRINLTLRRVTGANNLP